jgi:hypothetical protein
MPRRGVDFRDCRPRSPNGPEFAFVAIRRNQPATPEVYSSRGDLVRLNEKQDSKGMGRVETISHRPNWTNGNQLDLAREMATGLVSEGHNHAFEYLCGPHRDPTRSSQPLKKSLTPDVNLDRGKWTLAAGSSWSATYEKSHFWSRGQVCGPSIYTDWRSHPKW